MKTRYKILIIAVALFVVLDLPFFTSLTIVDSVFHTSHLLHFWSVPINTDVSGIKSSYHVGEPITFTVTHNNFGYYQEYPQYEISQKNNNVPVIYGGMTGDSISYGPFTILTIWPGHWNISEYEEQHIVDTNGKKIDSPPKTDEFWDVVSEKKPIALYEPGYYTLYVYSVVRNEEIAIPFEVVENEN